MAYNGNKHKWNLNRKCFENNNYEKKTEKKISTNEMKTKDINIR